MIFKDNLYSKIIGSTSYSTSFCLITHCVRLFATPRTVACQAPLSMAFSKQEYWSGLPFTSPGYLPNPGI